VSDRALETNQKISLLQGGRSDLTSMLVNYVLISVFSREMYARKLSEKRQLPDTNTAHLELSDVAPRSAAAAATVAVAHLELELLVLAGFLGLSRHSLLLAPLRLSCGTACPSP